MGRRTVAVGRLIALVAVALLAALVLAGGSLWMLANTRLGRERLAQKLELMLAGEGIHATLRARLELLPLRLVLEDVLVPAPDGHSGPPTFEAPRVVVRPRIAALLCGRLEVASIDYEAPTLRVVHTPTVFAPAGDAWTRARDRLTGHWRVRRLVVRNGRVEVSWGPVHVMAAGIEATARAYQIGGTLHIRAGEGRVEQPAGGGHAYSDALCALDASVRIHPGELVIDRFEARGVPEVGHETPACAVPDATADRVEFKTEGAAIELDSTGHPSLARGRVVARAPLALLDRTGRVDRFQGWVGVDADVRYVFGRPLPEARGSVQAHDVTVGDFRVARAIDARLIVANDVLLIPLADIDTTSGRLRVSDFELRPLAPGAPIRARVEGGRLRFEELLRAIHVSRHPHVRWAIESFRWDEVEGTISPLSISGRFAAKTGSFTVFDGACDLEPCARIWGFSRSTIRARATLTSDAFELDDVRATLTGGEARASRVVVGFHDVLSVEDGHGRLALARDSPLASLAVDGQLQADARVFGRLSDPVVDFSGTVDRFVLDGDPLGDVASVQGRYHDSVLRFDAVRAHKGTSFYDVPSLRIAFGHHGHLDVDAIVRARELRVRDLLSLARLDQRPAFATLGGTLTDARARVRFVHLGHDDPLGQGTIFVSADAGLVAPTVFGRRFDQGSVGVDVRWWDQAAGLAGVDVDLRTIELRDRGVAGMRQPAGSILASAQLRGGAIRATAVAASVPLVRLVTPSGMAAPIEGRLSGVAHAAGTIEALAASADLEVTSLIVGKVPFGPSSLHLDAGLGALVPLRVSATGTLLGGEAYVHELVADDRGLRGRASLRSLRIDPLVRAASREDGTPPSRAVEAVVSGELTLDALNPSEIAHARASFIPTAFSASLGVGTAQLRPNGAALVLADDAISFPPLHMVVTFPELHVVKAAAEPRSPVALSRAAPGNKREIAATLRGLVTSLSRDPQVDFEVAVPHADLALLVGVVPDVTSVEGTVAALFTAKGPLSGPTLGGGLRAHADTADVSWIPSELRDIDIDVAVDQRELRVVRASAKLGDGSIKVTGGSTITGLLPGVAHLALNARGVRLSIAPGVDTAFDANARVLIDVRRLLRGASHAVSVAGDAMLDALTYRRPLDTSSARRTDTGRGEYDPSRDVVDFALRLRARAPIRVEDDVASMRFAQVGDFWLRGTNQRPSLDGRLTSLGGGKLHVRGIALDVAHATLDFDDPAGISPRVDLVATTYYQRQTAFEAPMEFASSSGARGAEAWRIWLKAIGGRDDLHVELTSDPPLSQSDIVLLLALGMTRPELDAMQATVQLQASAGLEVLAGLGGAERIVRDVVPIDEVRFGATYSPLSLLVVPDVTLGKRIGERLAATVTSSLAYQRIVGGTVSWWLGSNVWFEALWENVTPVPVYPVGDFGLGLRWHLDL